MAVERAFHAITALYIQRGYGLCSNLEMRRPVAIGLSSRSHATHMHEAALSTSSGQQYPGRSRSNVFEAWGSSLVGATCYNTCIVHVQSMSLGP